VEAWVGNERTLRVRFETVEALRQEFQSNLSNGGLFVATEAACELREPVCVHIELAFANATFELPGEVVHVVPAELAATGATPGVALQLHENPAALCERLEPHMGGAPDGAPEYDVRRRWPRTRARVAARIGGEDGVVSGRTRDLSQGGALVGVDAAVETGQSVQLTLQHPTTGEEMEVAGRVVREVEGESGVTAVAVEFDLPDAQREAVEGFVEDIQRVEHARRLGGIVGAIESLGPQNIVQMFATTAPEGSVILRSGSEEGTIVFQGGLLRSARIGTLVGMKALVRMLAWSEGSFEFQASVEDGDVTGAPLPLEAALLDAARQLDEGGRVDATRFPLHAKLAIGPQAPGGRDLSKVEAAVLDLARVGFSVERVLEVIPEPDPEILRALDALSDEDLVELNA
jgi:Tfp pilus assembly protein PilZ